MKKVIDQKTWEILVRKARQCVGKYETDRFKVAELAIQACDLRHGGRKDTRFTIKSFSQAIELNYRTLYEWIRIKRLVVDRLQIKTDYKKISYDVLVRVSGRVTESTSKKQVRTVLNEEMNVSPEIAKWKKYQQHLNSIIYNGAKPIQLLEIPDQTIIEVVQKATLIKNLFEKELAYRQKGQLGGKEVLKKNTRRFEKSVNTALEMEA